MMTSRDIQSIFIPQVLLLIGYFLAAVINQDAELFWEGSRFALYTGLFFSNLAWVSEVLDRRKLKANHVQLEDPTFGPGPARLAVVTLWIGFFLLVGISSRWLTLITLLTAILLFIFESLLLDFREKKWRVSSKLRQ